MRDVRVGREGDDRDGYPVAEVPLPGLDRGGITGRNIRLVVEVHRVAHTGGRREGEVGNRLRVHQHLLGHCMDASVRVGDGQRYAVIPVGRIDVLRRLGI